MADPQSAPLQTALPIDSVLPEVIARLRSEAALVLSAAPGAGKTTRVPAAILSAGLSRNGSIVVLEPRPEDPSAARATAQVGRRRPR